MPGKLFTIALPVRNGGAFLRPCVESILGQSCGDFDLAILDNASTDGTTDYLASLRDSRVRLYPADRPLSITENWARIKGIQKNDFLTIIGHDDLLDPNFLEVIGNLIETHPEAALYLTHFRLIDEHGQMLRPCRPMPGRETAAEFLAARLADLRDSFGTGYVLRSAAYDALGGIPPFPRLLYADDMLWLRTMTGGGGRVTSPEECFSYRYHAGSAARTTPRSDYFSALDMYWDELEKLACLDVEVARSLKRYGPAYLTLFGHGNRLAILDGRILHGEAANAALDAQLERLISRAGLTIEDF
jgi:glycosyltransferase involved in cell wall biosynthesis